MANKAYNRGSAFERRIKRELEEIGFYVIKSAGSKGAVDLSATSLHGVQVWIQCKKDGKISKVDYDKLADLGMTYNITVLLVSKPKRNEPVKYEYISASSTFSGTAIGWQRT